MDSKEFNFPLLPHRFRYIGIVLIPLGFFFGYLYFYGSRPVFFETRVFAVVTTYMENRFFVLARTNLLDELFAILSILGVALIVFSREKSEKEGYDLIRAAALIKAVYISLMIWILSFLVIFGWAIFLACTILFIIFLITYYITFRILISKL